MSFENTEQLIHNLNTSPLAILPMLNDISANMVSVNSGIELTTENNKKIEESFLNEYNENNKREIPFFGCPNNVFIKSYQDDLKSFLKQFCDGNEADFIETEFSIGVMKFEFPFAGENMNATIRLSLKRRFEFLVDRLNILGYDFQYFIENGDGYSLGYKESFKILRNINFKNEERLNSSLKWQKSQTDLVEVIKGFSLKKCFGDISEIELSKHFEHLFNFKINDYESTKGKITGKVNDLTPFLNDMIYRIVKWRKELDEKKRKNYKC